MCILKQFNGYKQSKVDEIMRNTWSQYQKMPTLMN